MLLTDANESVEKTLLYYGKVAGGGANLALNYALLNAAQGGCNGTCMADLVAEWMSSKEEFVTTDWMVYIYYWCTRTHPKLLDKLCSPYLYDHSLIAGFDNETSTLDVATVRI